MPRLIVGGRFSVLGNNAKSYADLFAIADALIERARRG